MTAALAVPPSPAHVIVQVTAPAAVSVTAAEPFGGLAPIQPSPETPPPASQVVALAEPQVRVTA